MSEICRKLLAKRGVAADFLSPKYAPDKVEMVGMKQAIKRIKKAISQQEKVLVYGDYDVDGVTATALIVDALKLAGLKEVVTMLPDRFIDGYGMSERCVERAKEEKAKLVVTVDCGSNNREIVAELNKIGVDTVVTDHHEIMGELPDAVAVVNPKRADNKDLEAKKLAGVGVAFMLARALAKEGMIPDGQEKWFLDLVLIGTICDSMSLTGINRELTFYGLKVLEKTRRQGLIELLRVSGVKRLDGHAIGYQIGPRLNAGGRMESAEIALKLLLTKSRAKAALLAGELDKLNLSRREEQQNALLEIEQQNDFKNSKVIVVAGKWHEGVIGIIAGRLVEKYHKPVFVLTEVAEDKDGDGVLERGERVLKGSGRSFGDFNLAEALKYCDKQLISGGGHAGACGVKILAENLEEFREKVEEYYAGLGLKNQEGYFKICPELEVDNLSDMSLGLMDELSQFEPFGKDNEEPTFLLKDSLILDTRAMGEAGKHLAVSIRDEKGTIMKLVAFSAQKEWFDLPKGERRNFIVKLARNEWQGQTRVEGMILGVE